MLILDENNPIIPIDKKYVEADIEIYGTKRDIIKKVPVKLYIGASYGHRFPTGI
ncbi:MAG: hypothetical protein BME93_00620 [Methanosarcinales archaeon Met12]|nr:MAG: hypothetical protein BME93_00620 [Methanosarcinales archaeon Met12]